MPVLLALAWSGATAWFVALFALALASDVLDGALARRLGEESDVGARLDQWGDFALWASLPLAAWWLWAEIVRREAPYGVLAVLCLLGPTAVAWLKYRGVPGYHTWTAKLDSVAMGAGVPLLLLFDVASPFRAAGLFLVVCAIDELGITFLLRECRNDVASVFHAARLRRTGAGRAAPGS